jgi:hypothetical protein
VDTRVLIGSPRYLGVDGEGNRSHLVKLTGQNDEAGNRRIFSGASDGRSMRKFMVTVDDGVFRDLEQLARRRDITIQELFRAVIIPGWIERAVVQES